jgi:hypothetical protein
LLEGARCHSMSKGVRLLQGMCFAAVCNRRIEALVHEFRIGQQDERIHVGGIEFGRFRQKRFGSRIVVRLHLHSAEVDVA